MKTPNPPTQRLLLPAYTDERELPTRRLAVEVEPSASPARRLPAVHAVVPSPDPHGSPFWVTHSQRVIPPLPVIEVPEVHISVSEPVTMPKEHAWWEAIVMSTVASAGAALVHFAGLWARADGHVTQSWRVPVLTGTAILALQMCILAAIAFKRSIRDEPQSHSGKSWLWVAGVVGAAPLCGLALACGADDWVFTRDGAPNGWALVSLIVASVFAAELMVRMISWMPRRASTSSDILAQNDTRIRKRTSAHS